MTAVQINMVNTGLTDEQREGVTGLLMRLLADEHILYMKTRKYHWNVVGELFHSLHNLFEEQYTILADRIDDIAERIRALGPPAIGTLQEFRQHTTLAEATDIYPDAVTMVANLVTDHETVIRNLRHDLRACDEQYDDMGTSDFLTGLMEIHEEMAWMLRAFLQERP